MMQEDGRNDSCTCRQSFLDNGTAVRAVKAGAHKNVLKRGLLTNMRATSVNVPSNLND
jgi:hypothetical protein